MSPGQPEAGKQQKAEKIQVKLAGPGQRADIAKENRQNIQTVTCGDNRGVRGDGCEDQDQENSEKSHKADISILL